MARNEADEPLRVQARAGECLLQALFELPRKAGGDVAEEDELALPQAPRNLDQDPIVVGEVLVRCCRADQDGLAAIDAQRAFVESGKPR